MTRRKRDALQTLDEFTRWLDTLPTVERERALRDMADRMDAVARRLGLGAPIDRGEQATECADHAVHAKTH